MFAAGVVVVAAVVAAAAAAPPCAALEVAPASAGVSVAAGLSWLVWGDKGSATTFLIASVEKGEGLAMIILCRTNWRYRLLRRLLKG